MDHVSIDHGVSDQTYTTCFDEVMKSYFYVLYRTRSQSSLYFRIKGNYLPKTVSQLQIPSKPSNVIQLFANSSAEWNKKY